MSTMLLPLLVRQKALIANQLNILHFVRFQSSYVQRVHLIQNLKDNNLVPDNVLEKSRFALFHNYKPLVAEGPDDGFCIPWKKSHEISKHLRELQPVLLTTDTSPTNEELCTPEGVSFAINVPGEEDMAYNVVTGFATEMRKGMIMMSQMDAKTLMQGYGLLKWHSMNRFCPNCGTETISDVVGSKRVCEECSLVNYPKMAPIIITLVTDSDRCLVVRQPSFPSRMYSALAGFCELGETIEMSTQREVAEEVGLMVDCVKYHQSQHWPFPSSGLMIGCYAKIKPGTAHQLCLDEKELEDAKWLSRDEVRNILESNTHSKPGQLPIWFPPPVAIAHHLLTSWAYIK